VLFGWFYDMLLALVLRRPFIKSVEKDINVAGNDSFFILWNLNAFPVRFPVEYEINLIDI